MKCVVTGGTGYLGSRLTNLLEGEGHEVAVVSRQMGQDILRPESLRKPFRDAETVFHLAALVQSRPGPFEATNLQGLRNVLEICEESKVNRAIVVSSFTVFGPSGEQAHQEDRIPERSSFFHGYDESKYRAFRELESWRGRLPINVIFPTVIFGPGPMTEGNILARLLQRWKKLRLAALQGRGRPVWNFVYIDDVARGLIESLKAAPGESFILGGEDRSIQELFKTFKEVSGHRIASLRLPDFGFRMGAHLEDLVSRIGGFPPLVLPSTADFFLNDWRFSSEKARRELGYNPRSLQAGLQSTHRWMKQEGMV